jgi:hypothetical protein
MISNKSTASDPVTTLEQMLHKRQVNAFVLRFFMQASASVLRFFMCDSGSKRDLSL